MSVCLPYTCKGVARSGVVSDISQRSTCVLTVTSSAVSETAEEAVESKSKEKSKMKAKKKTEEKAKKKTEEGTKTEEREEFDQSLGDKCGSLSLEGSDVGHLQDTPGGATPLAGVHGRRKGVCEERGPFLGPEQARTSLEVEGCE